MNKLFIRIATILMLSLTGCGGGGGSTGNPSTGGSVTPSISIADTSAAEGNTTPPATLTFTVTLSAAFTSDITIHYATSDDTALAASDYTATSGTLTIPAGATSGTIDVPITGENTYEADETLTMTLSAPTGATLATATAIGTITNDDAMPTVSVSMPASIIEGNVGTTTLNPAITLSAVSGFDTTITYSYLTGTGNNGGSGPVTIPKGQLSPSPASMFHISIIGDTLYESNESAVLTLNTATNATIGTATATTAITNDDAMPSISVATASVNEGNAGTSNLDFTITLSTASGAITTVNYLTTDGSATRANNDYTLASGTVSIPAGSTTGTARVFVTGDTVFEADENLVLTLSSPVNATILGSSNIGTIINDDVPSLSVAAASVVEGNAGTSNLVFTVNLSAASPMTVAYATADGTALAASDYTATSGTLTIAANATSGTITVPVSGDTQIEVDETLTLTLSNPTNSTIATASATGTITNDDIPSLSVAAASVVEGNAGTSNLVFTVNLSAASPMTVAYATADGTALAASDYTATSGTLTIAANATSGTITVPVSGDTQVEPDETLTLNLSNPTNSTITTASATGTIINDDIPTLSVAAASVVEGNAGTSNLVFTVNLSALSPNAVTVAYATADGTALAASDYTATSGTLTIAANATSGTISVPVSGDTQIEVDETLTLTLSNPTNSTIATASATGTITNDDIPSLSVAAASVVEGNAGTSNLVFTVNLSAASPMTVAYATADGTALAASDYTATSGTLTIAANATSGTITVPVSGDTQVEPDETLTLTLSNPTNSTIATASATGTILTDDVLVPVLDIANVGVVEGNLGTSNAVFTVNLSAATTVDITVAYATTDSTATTANGDYTNAAATLTIAAGATSGSFTVVINGDTVKELNETLTATLSAPTNATLGKSTATATIFNDDAFGLNDTGITIFSFPNHPAQDAGSGRDVTFPSNTDGHAGFVFTKLDNAGVPLNNQAATYGTTPWSCVQDSTTGLMWEVKTTTAGLHNNTNTYTWFNSTGVNDGGTAGTANGGTCTGSGCDTEKYVAAVNALTGANRLCGYTDWRLPSTNELYSIVDLSISGKTIDANYFPNTSTVYSYWTATPFAFVNPTYAWNINFSIGAIANTGKQIPRIIRLVRGTP